ncbi:MAG: glycine zipper 2TM domain-containing protein [Burkholderiales bacterium]|nr:glycine zipper 2TM domain-containing protein [Burkholderiales bacterium]
MKLFRISVSVVSLAALFALGACTNAPLNSSDSGSSYPQSNIYPGYGVVQSIELVPQANTGIGASTVIGGVVGGLLGNQVGQGDGKTAATVLGAAGGAYAGHELEKRKQQQAPNAYKITVRMNDGAHQTWTQNTSGDLRVGDRVKIENGTAQRY